MWESEIILEITRVLLEVRVRGFSHTSSILICSFLSVCLKSSAVSPRRVDPDNIQVAEVDAFFIIPVVTGAAFGPHAVWMWSLSRQLCLV